LTGEHEEYMRHMHLMRDTMMTCGLRFLTSAKEATTHAKVGMEALDFVKSKSLDGFRSHCEDRKAAAERELSVADAEARRCVKAFVRSFEKRQTKFNEHELYSLLLRQIGGQDECEQHDSTLENPLQKQPEWTKDTLSTVEELSTSVAKSIDQAGTIVTSMEARMSACMDTMERWIEQARELQQIDHVDEDEDDFSNTGKPSFLES